MFDAVKFAGLTPSQSDVGTLTVFMANSSQKNMLQAHVERHAEVTRRVKEARIKQKEKNEAELKEASTLADLNMDALLLEESLAKKMQRIPVSKSTKKCFSVKPSTEESISGATSPQNMASSCAKAHPRETTSAKEDTHSLLVNPGKIDVEGPWEIVGNRRVIRQQSSSSTESMSTLPPVTLNPRPRVAAVLHSESALFVRVSNLPPAAGAMQARDVSLTPAALSETTQVALSIFSVEKSFCVLNINAPSVCDEKTAKTSGKSRDTSQDGDKRADSVHLPSKQILLSVRKTRQNFVRGNSSRKPHPTEELQPEQDESAFNYFNDIDGQLRHARCMDLVRNDISADRYQLLRQDPYMPVLIQDYRGLYHVPFYKWIMRGTAIFPGLTWQAIQGVMQKVGDRFLSGEYTVITSFDPHQEFMFTDHRMGPLRYHFFWQFIFESVNMRLSLQ
jgi:hypothetical protein